MSFSKKNAKDLCDMWYWFILISTFCKSPAKFIYYRSYNNYNKEEFQNVLKHRLVSFMVSSSNFE